MRERLDGGRLDRRGLVRQSLVPLEQLDRDPHLPARERELREPEQGAALDRARLRARGELPERVLGGVEVAEPLRQLRVRERELGRGAGVLRPGGEVVRADAEPGSQLPQELERRHARARLDP